MGSMAGEAKGGGKRARRRDRRARDRSESASMRCGQAWGKPAAVEWALRWRIDRANRMRTFVIVVWR